MSFNPITMGVLEILLNAQDPDAPCPSPAVGESVVDFHVRVIKYQAYLTGMADGLDYDALVANGYESRPNPYETP